MFAHPCASSIPLESGSRQSRQRHSHTSTYHPKQIAGKGSRPSRITLRCAAYGRARASKLPAPRRTSWSAKASISRCNRDAMSSGMFRPSLERVYIRDCHSCPLTGLLLCLSLYRDCSAVQCECDFRVAVAWNTKDPPTITKVNTTRP